LTRCTAQEAADIFGDVGALMEMYDMARTQKATGDDEQPEDGGCCCFVRGWYWWNTEAEAHAWNLTIWMTVRGEDVG